MDLSEYPKELRSIDYHAHSLYSKLSFSAKIHIDLQDLIQAGRIGLWKAIKGHDESKGASLTTYANIRIYGEIIDTIRKFGHLDKRAYRNCHISFVEIKEDDLVLDHNTDVTDLHKLLDNITNKKTKRIMDKYMKGYFNEQIANEEGCSGSNIGYVVGKVVQGFRVQFGA